MTPEELVSRLAPVRVPADFARFGVQDVLVAVSLGLLAGVLVAMLVRVLTAPRPRKLETARAGIAAMADLPPQERMAGLASLLRALGGTVPAVARDALYDPHAKIDPVPLEDAVLAAARRGRK
ncbi:hypothetical protein [Sagittula stellata]|uniref:Uncharacterized protein n=1 Tax=Sagittula stellata (strain ATCC 700073 / DSM 11524 / E-37) TaxID=388399 RepID=A3K872_SAGS3|nr:hypothetical protein [Sagittula stellata]EBA06551.1 hypothetical protein SSE37_09858 [Sagittula stellata E-37]